ncbi:MAG: hypothetical protein JWO80_6424, partial [Bryobacterales bacterium]|nr:hypothetical protein [Bryobacterales bacterium]
MKELPIRAKLYIAVTIILGACLLAAAIPLWSSAESLRFLLYLAAALLASNLKVVLPGITGTMSVNFVFVLISIMDLNLLQVLSISYAGTAGQVLFRSKDRQLLRLLFNLSSTTISTFCCYCVYHSSWIRSVNGSIPMLLFFASVTLFLVNTVSVA